MAEPRRSGRLVRRTTPAEAAEKIAETAKSVQAGPGKQKFEDLRGIMLDLSRVNPEYLDDVLDLLEDAQESLGSALSTVREMSDDEE
jgi:hypothetical protein